MSTDDQQDGNLQLSPTTEQAYQDGLIARRLPAWLRRASIEQLSALGDALSLSHYFNSRVGEVLGAIQGIDGFALTTLQQALDSTFGDGLDASSLQLRWGRREPVVTSQPIGYPVTVPVYAAMPLLEAALRNFTEADAEEGGQLPGNRLLMATAGSAAAPRLPTSVQFAAACRKLDLGAQYQRHLSTVLRPPAGIDEPEDEGRRQVLSLFARAHRYAMLADAHVALLKDELTAAEHRLLIELCSLHSPLKLAGDRVVYRRLELFDCPLEQIVVLDVRDERLSPVYTSSKRVLVHIPGDPLAPWRAYVDLRHFANDLGKRLRTADYQRFFSRFVKRHDSQAFFSRVIEGYEGVTDLANIDLQERLRECPAPLFDTLASSRIQQILDDAAMLAVPTATVDRQVQQAHDRRLEAEGWALLNLAGLFVPGLGLALLAFASWQLLREVYLGVDAWHEGDSAEALEHLVNVATDLAVLGATAAGIGVARYAWSRSRWVDGLVPETVEAGGLKLCRADPTAYRVAAPPALASCDEQGVYRLGEQAWIEMDGHHYPVVQRAIDGQWCLRARQGLGPRLCHNGAGAWRLWYEQPAEWDDAPRMFRRLGMAFAELDDSQVELAMVAHDIDAKQLRALHVQGQPPPAEWVDSVTRFAIDRRVTRAIDALRSGHVPDDPQTMLHVRALAPATVSAPRALGQLAARQRPALFQACYEAAQVSDVEGSATVRRMFPGLHRLAANALLRACSAAERQIVKRQGRVPLRLGQAVRASVRRIRLARALQGLSIHAAQSTDLARVALTLSERSADLLSAVHWRLIDAATEQAVMLETAAEGGHPTLDLIHRDGAFQVREGGQLRVGPGELFDVLAAAYRRQAQPGSALDGLTGDQLRQLLGASARHSDRQLATLFESPSNRGWFNPPRRLADGRIGYPLSGRGRGRVAGLYAMVRALYPAFDDAQVESWLVQVRAMGRQVETELTRLAAELETLNSYLRNWCRLAGDHLQRADRRSFTEGLVACWQRRTVRSNALLPEAYRLTIRNLSLDRLPDLPEHIRFGHVRELSLMAIGVSEIPATFLRAFDAVRILELASNGLTQVPASLGQLPSLRELDLYGNQIVLDAAQGRTLERCANLQYLNLSHNPLGRGFSLQRMPHLRRLLLRSTGLEELPAGLLTRYELALADLRDNRLQRVPERFYQAPPWISTCIRLDGNPLREADAQRWQAFMSDHGWSAEVEETVGLTAARQRWLDTADGLARTEHAAIWDELEVHDNASDFFQLLGRLLQTADFQQHRLPLSLRVFSMLRAMSEYQALRIELFAQASLPVTCQDSAALAFSNLELRMLVWQARRDAAAGGEQTALLRLGRQLWRLDEVDRIAARDYATRQASGADPDQIEVLLAYRVGLREALSLPAQPSDMLFAEVAALDQQHIDAAREEVLALQTPERLSQALVDRDFWREHLQQANAERFESLDASFHARVDTLMDAADTLAEGQYLEQMNQVQSEREVARRALMLRLTLHAVEADAAAPERR